MYTSRYNLAICNSIGLKSNKLQVLDYIVEWIENGHATYIIHDDMKMYWIDVKYMANALNICYATAKNSLKFLAENHLVNKTCIITNENHKLVTKLYVSLNYQEYIKYILDNNYNQSRYSWIIAMNNKEPNTMIFEEFAVEKSNDDIISERIVRDILTKYSCYFKHRIPAENQKPTKTYSNILRIIKDIYNGNYINPRLYPLGEDFLSSKTFDITGWKNQLKSVIGNWEAVEDLIFRALTNFELMHNKSRLPYNKKYLSKNLNLWFYDSFTKEGEGQSQFIQCLFEPDYIANYHSEMKADRIYESLPTAIKIAGNKLYDLNKTMYAGAFWENVEHLYNWSKTAYQYEPGMMYWLGESDKIINKFYDFCCDRNITMSTATVDISKAIETSGPLVWFIKDACSDYNMNIKLAECSTIDDIESLYCR